MSIPTVERPEFWDIFTAKLHGSVMPKLMKATIPIFGFQESQKQPIVRDRTGVLLRIADKTFLVTAAHSLRAIVQHKIPVFIGWSEAIGKPVPLTDCQFHTTEEESRDIGLIRLSEQCVAELKGSFEPITMPDVYRDDEHPIQDGLFLTLGFPMAWMQILPDRIHNAELGSIGPLYSGQKPKFFPFGYDAKLHLLVEFTRNVQRLQDGVPVELPEFKGIQGISGCGVWRICKKLSHSGVTGWNPDDVRLVGIEHRYWEKDGFIAATRIELALGFILENYPELKPSMNLLYRD